VFLLGDFCSCRSFAETCTRIQGALRSKVFSGLAGSEKDDLVCLSFNAIKVVYSVRLLRDNFLLHF
jgi:hypothetical protein